MLTGTIIKYTLLGDTAASPKPLYLPTYDELTTFPGSTYLSNLGLWSLIFAVLVVLLALVLSSIIDKKYKTVEHFANRWLTVAFILVWIFGFVVYDIGMYTGEPWSLLGNVPMAIVHAFGIFIFESDVSAIHEPFHNNAWFMAGFSLVHLLAAIVSLVFVLKIFGFNTMSAIRRFFARRTKDKAYVFWGMNDASYYLAKDIIKTEKGNDDYRIIVVRTTNDTETTNAVNGINRLFNFLSMRNKDLDRLTELNCITTSTYTNITTIDTKDKNPIDILNHEMRLYSLCRILKNINSDIHIFFLSDNEKGNILAVENLLKDKTIRELQDDRKIIFYCHARYNSVHRVIEDENITKNIDVNVVDSSRISVELLKNNPALHPVDYVKIEKDATVSTPFNAMVVGFGEVGMDAVRFLYEFGAFVKTRRNGEEKVQRSEFHCHVFDKNMDNIAGQFFANAPSISLAVNPTAKDYDSGYPLYLYDMECQSIDFYKKLESMITHLNYIVVATGDDEMNISLAVRIFRHAIRYRQNLHNFRIMVRIKNNDNDHILNIARHYNRLWAAEEESINNSESLKANRLNQKTIKSDQIIDSPITLFGLAEQVYTYDSVIKEALKEKAKEFKFKYDSSLYGETSKDCWDNEQNKLLQLDKEFSGYSPTFSGVMKLRRVQSQNIANSLHIKTKEKLAEAALGDGYKKDLQHLERENNTTKYRWKDNVAIPIEKYQKVLDTLAETEHLRWNASHEILGYQFNGGSENEKDEARLLHGCLKDWDELSEEMKSKDYDTVDVTLNINTIAERDV